MLWIILDIVLLLGYGFTFVMFLLNKYVPSRIVIGLFFIMILLYFLDSVVSHI